VISATDEAWKSQRGLLHAQFTTAGVRRYEQRITDAAQRVARRWADKAQSGQLVDVGEDMQFFALDTIWRLLTDQPLTATMYQELSSIEVVVAALPTMGGASTISETADQALEQINATAYRVIDAARRQHTAGTRTGVLYLLLDAAETRPEYTDELIRDELVTLIVAGYETTAKTLSWLFALLDQHRDIREWAATDDNGSTAARQDVFQALVSETLRLYPAVWLIPRHASEDDIVDGFQIDAGTDVLLCPYLTHRDPTLWSQPENFCPDRFLTAGNRPRRPGSYIPFGIGPRACLGQQFAMREMVTLLGELLPRYVPEFDDLRVAPAFGANLRPNGSMLARIHTRPSNSTT
jgi:cytochrome P450